jgi:hypothetical protein
MPQQAYLSLTTPDGACDAAAMEAWRDLPGLQISMV